MYNNLSNNLHPTLRIYVTLFLLVTNVALSEYFQNPNLLWHNSVSGEVKLMPINPRLIPENNSTVVDSSNLNLIPKGIGDFNGDSKPDILVHNQNTGMARAWLMDGTTRTANVALLESSNTNLQIAGLGDFDQDGDNDIATFNANSGALIIWEMDGTTKLGNRTVLRGANLNLAPKGVGDMNNDGIPDIILRNSNSGAVRVWTMNANFTRKGNEYVTGSSNTNLELRVVVDIDRDGNQDILNYNTSTGKLRAWLMNGAMVITENVSITQEADITWSVRGADYISENADYMSSYENSKTSIYINYDDALIGESSGVGYLDVEGDGDVDIFIGTFITGSITDKIDAILSINDGNENFSASTAEFSNNMPSVVVSRKVLVSDFNSDGLKDMLILDHGYDHEPFPGSQPKLIMQDSLGMFSWSELQQIGFNHGGAAGDIDNDGDIDLFIADVEGVAENNKPYFYINDGNANFTKNTTLFDDSILVVFTAELIDIDKDGFLDLLTGAHERDGYNTFIYWGSSTGRYTAANQTLIPAVSQMGVVLDFDAEDIDGDGDRDLIINRTRDGNDGGGLEFYVGRTTQLLRNNGNRSFTDITSTNIDDPGGDTDQWFPWIRVQDFDNDGDVDIRPDDAAFGFEYNNDGTGNFTKTVITP